MKISSEQLSILRLHYQSQEKNFPDSASARQQFQLAIEFLESKFDSYINLAALASSEGDAYVPEWHLTSQFLDNVLTIENNYIFNSSKAELESLAIIKKLNFTDLLLIYGSVNNFGIREKYIKNILKSEEWLTDLDLERMLSLTDTKDKIHIVNFSPASLGTVLHFEREKQKENPNSYDIPLLLNPGTNLAEQGSHWIAAVVTVNPVNRTVNYVIHDSSALTDDKKLQYETAIKNALNFNENNQFKAFPETDGWHLSGDIIEHDQPDTYSCGYRALHQLFQLIPQLAAQNEVAQEYAKIDAEKEDFSHKLQTAFYSAQLSTLIIPHELYIALDHNQQKKFSEFNVLKPVSVDKIALNRFLNNEPEKITESLVHEKVAHAISTLNALEKTLVFPAVPDATLTEMDYESFFKQLQTQLLNQENKLNILELYPATSKTLDGLNAYCGLIAGIAVEKIVINIDGDIQLNEFLPKLKMVLKNLSVNNLESLVFVDEKGVLEEKHWQEIAKFIAHAKVAVNIDLPSQYITTPIQSGIDNSVAKNQLGKKDNKLTTQRNLEALNSQPVVVRTRPKPKSTNVTVDIEVAQEQEVQVQTEQEVVPEYQRNNNNDQIVKAKGIKFEDFLELAVYVYDNVNLQSEEQLITSSQLKKDWYNWFGDISIYAAGGVRQDALKMEVSPSSSVKAYRNTAFFDLISFEAAQKLLNHRRLFQNGINPRRLPQGFILAESTEGPSKVVLHYDNKLSLQINDDIRPVITEKSQTKISFQLFDKIKERLNDNNPRNTLILNELNALEEGEYDRENHALFRKNLPFLLLLSEENLRKLFEISKSEGKLNVKFFDYLIKNQDRVTEIFKGKSFDTNPDNFDNENYIKLLNKFTAYSSDIESLNEYIVLAHDIFLQPKPDAKSHILWSLLDNDQELRNQVEEWSNKFKFTNKQLDALLQVYSEYSVAGLDKLFNAWSEIWPELFDDVFQILFSKAESFVPMLESDEIKNTLNTLEGLTPAKYEWFKTLLIQHVEAVGYDDLTPLFKAFNSFVEEIESNDLEFYPNVAFKDIKSMPVALANMLTILQNNVSDAERKAQWQLITEIDLSSQGAIRAILTEGRVFEKCLFVVPQMQIHAENYYSQGYKADTRSKIDNGKFIAEPFTSLEKSKEHFYRLLAHNPDRLPLPLYLKIEAKISQTSFPDHEKARLLAIVAESTMGKGYYSLDEENIEKIVTTLSGIIDTLKKPPIPSKKIISMLGISVNDLESKARTGFIDNLFQLGRIPPIEELNSLFKLFVSTMKIETWNPFKELEEKIGSLKERCTLLTCLTNTFGQAVYRGMKYYDEQTLSKTDDPIFYRHLDVALLLLQGDDLKLENDDEIVLKDKSESYISNLGEIVDFKKQKDNTFYLLPHNLLWLPKSANDKVTSVTEKFTPLLGIVSTFGLANQTKEVNRKTALQIHRAYRAALSNDPDGYFLSAISLLSRIKDNIEPSLTPNDLLVFIDKYNNSDNKEDWKNTKKIVENSFKKYFPVGYFDVVNKEMASIPTAVKTYIEKYAKDVPEKNTIISILERFPLRQKNVDKYQDIAVKILRIIAPLLKKDKDIFLNILSSKELFEDAELDEMDNILSSIIELGSPNEFTFFINKASKFHTQPVRDLFKKAEFYLKTILPQMEDLKSNTVSKMDSINLVIDLLLASDSAELESSLSMTVPDEARFDVIKTLLSHPDTRDADHLNNLIDTLDNFIKDNSEKYSLNALKPLREHLVDLKERPKAPVKIPNPVEPVPTSPITVEEASAITAIVDTVSVIATSGLQFASGWLKNVFGTSQDREPTPPMPPVRNVKAALSAIKTQPLPEAVVEQPKVINKELLVNARTELTMNIEAQKKFDKVFGVLFQTVYEVAEHYKGDKATITHFFRHFMSHKDSTQNQAQIIQARNNINVLKETFLELDNANILRSLCKNFMDKDDYSPESLVDLIKYSKDLKFEKTEKILFLKILTSLINKGTPCNLDDLKDFMGVAKERNLIGALQTIFETPPIPTLKQLKEWIKTKPDEVDDSEHLLSQYTGLDKNPCARELIVNGFHVDEAKRQAKLMDSSIEYTDQVLLEIKTAVDQVRNLSTADIKGELRDAGNPDIVSNIRLVALTAELMYRVKGLPGENNSDGKRKVGRSFEINTTQYLAIYSMLETGKHVTSQIETGEGKTRIQMLNIACQYARGQTVDFVTADLNLADREYLEYQSLFEALGAKTNLIYQNTPATEYRLNGINFSDATNLRLFRNQAISQGEGDYVINSKPEKRALVLDEADKIYFDLADTRFNHSALADESIRNMPWVYELLIDFFTQDSPAKDQIEDLFYNNVNACNNKLIAFAKASLGEDKAERLNRVSKNQLEAWQDSAHTALNLKFKDQFVIETNVDMQTRSGPKPVSKVYLVSGGEQNRSAKFSVGVYQCLHAYLNKLKKNLPEITLTELEIALSNCKEDFYIEDEKQIFYSATTKSFMDDYNNGTVCAVTGTYGSIKEVEEARQMYGHGSNDMQFIIVPRHKVLQREDFPLFLAQNADAKFNLQVQEIKQARLENRPVLLICKNDQESNDLMRKLQVAFPDDPNFIHIDAQTSPEALANHIKNDAGRSGIVTVATSGKMGRGVEIPLHGLAMKKGLKVLVDFLPPEREMMQIFGRAGRFGAQGDARIIVSKQEIKKQFGKTTLTDGYYTATNAYIKQLQAIMARKSQVVRLIKFTAADFNKQLTDNFFDDFYKNIPANEREAASAAWSKFIGLANMRWNQTWKKIEGELDDIHPVFGKIEEEFVLYEKFVQADWTNLRASLKESYPNQKETLAKLNDFAPSEFKFNPLKFKESDKKLLGEFNVNKIIPLKTSVAKKYDPAHDGKAVLYPTLGAKLKAWWQTPFFADLRAWSAGRGILFPNLRAWVSGAMTFGEFLTGVSGQKKVDEPPAVIIEAVEEPVVEMPLNASTVTMMKEGIASSHPKPNEDTSDIDEIFKQTNDTVRHQINHEQDETPVIETNLTDTDIKQQGL